MGSWVPATLASLGIAQGQHMARRRGSSVDNEDSLLLCPIEHDEDKKDAGQRMMNVCIIRRRQEKG